MAAKIPSYRLALTEPLIQHILNLALTEQPAPSSLSLAVVAKLAPLRAKIQAQAIQPAFTAADPSIPKPTLAEQLGALSSPASSLSKEQQWEDAYNLTQLDPESCTVQDFNLAKHYRYAQGLMSPEEVTAYEAEQLELGI